MTGEQTRRRKRPSGSRAVEIVVVTLGPDGAMARDGGELIHGPARGGEADTAGAGDLLCAAYVWADLRRRLEAPALVGPLRVAVGHRAHRRRRRGHAGAADGGRTRPGACRHSATRRADRRRTRRSSLLLLQLATLVAGCGAPGRRARATPSTADEAKKLGPVAPPTRATSLTIWDQEVRSGQASRIAQLNEELLIDVPERQDQARREVVHRPEPDDQAGRLGHRTRPTWWEANQGRQVIGPLVKGGLLKPLDDHAKYGWNKRWTTTLLDVNVLGRRQAVRLRQPLRPLPGVAEIVGVYYNKDEASSAGCRRRSPTSRRSSARPSRVASPRSCSATSTSGRDPRFETLLTSSPQEATATSYSPRTA